MKNANLPANPITQEMFDEMELGRESIEEGFGLTKREKFAMAAMQGLIGGEDHSGWSKSKSVQAVYIADKTLEALEDTNE